MIIVSLHLWCDISPGLTLSGAKDVAKHYSRSYAVAPSVFLLQVCHPRSAVAPSGLDIHRLLTGKKWSRTVESDDML
jgi:hypothetical protein